MKIIYIANARIPTEKAHGIQIMKMCEAFANAGNEVELVVPRRLNNIKDNPFEYYGIKQNFKIIKLPTLDLVKFGKIGFWIQSISFAKFAVIYSLFRKKDFIYSRDEILIYFLSFFTKRLYWETHIGKNNFFVRKALKKSGGIVSITQGLKDFYVNELYTNSSKVFVAPDGVDLDEFMDDFSNSEFREQMGLPLDKKIIGYVGKFRTMGKRKGGEDLIEAFSNILKSNKRLFLMLVGLNQFEIKEVEDIFNGLKISSDNYKIIQHLSRKEVIPFLKVSDMLIMNYPDSEHYSRDMSPMKLFEYMASGTPIISSDLPSIREILDESNSILVDLSQPNGLVLGMNRVLQNADLADRISKRALEDIKNYTWELRVENIINYINKL